MSHQPTPTNICSGERKELAHVTQPSSHGSVLTELQLPRFSDSGRQNVVQSICQLNDYFRLKNVEESLETMERSSSGEGSPSFDMPQNRTTQNQYPRDNHYNDSRRGRSNQRYVRNVYVQPNRRFGDCGRYRDSHSRSTVPERGEDPHGNQQHYAGGET
jgi:hypothetical protein